MREKHIVPLSRQAIEILRETGTADEAGNFGKTQYAVFRLSECTLSQIGPWVKTPFWERSGAWTTLKKK